MSTPRTLVWGGAGGRGGAFKEQGLAKHCNSGSAMPPYELILNCSLQFPLYTLAIVNARQKIIPVVWMISSRETADCVEGFLQAALSEAQKLRPDFMPGSVHCDDAKAEQLAIKYVFHLLRSRLL